LRSIDLDLPHGQLIVFCGVSGSGKTSLALDTLYAEGQRRYIESFSAYTRQFLERLEKPDAESIEGIPPAIAVAHRNTAQSSRSTVGTATETSDYLRLLMARVGKLHCLGCGDEVRRDTPEQIADRLMQLPEGTRYLIAFRAQAEDGDAGSLAASLQEDGFRRAIVGDAQVDLDQIAAANAGATAFEVVVDRLAAGQATEDRLVDSIETALAAGGGACRAWIESSDPPDESDEMLDGRRWRRLSFTRRLRCEACELDYAEPEPRLFSFNSPLGACSECEGFGNIIDIDMDLVAPDRTKTIRGGAIAPWNTPAYEHELQELLALADDYSIPVDIPFDEVDDASLQRIQEGVPERDFGGLRGFFAWLERRKYKMHLRVFLSRWRSYGLCPECHGARLKPESLAWRVAGRNLADLSRMKIHDARDFFDSVELTPWEEQVGQTMLDQVKTRLRFLDQVGVGYLMLDRTLRTLSGGEAQRVAMTSALGSDLVQMLYVLDEPSVGLHPADIDRLTAAVRRLTDRGNTVIVVEHEEALIRAAEQIVEIGPGAGSQGGRVVFQGTPDEIENSEKSLTGAFLAGRRGVSPPGPRRPTEHGWVKVLGARGNNLKNIDAELPLGVLCVVTGVSGAGKSTLVQDTLYPALCRRLRKDAAKPLAHDDVLGDGQIEDVILVDQSPIGRSPRSNPVTYIKAFDAIRAVFADTIDARTNNFTASHFSFNVDGGRCNQCQGDGYLEIDMQFLADVFMKCPQCGGRRYRSEILEVLYRGRNIADVLDMTVREAFAFFRGHPKVQTRLKRLIDVGLDYVRLGQPANTLSGGEAQRLKLATYISATKRGRTLFLLDEPTTGLHFADVVQLIDCFDALLAVGHSLIVVEHNLQLIKAADYLLDLGPGAADEGGRIVASGTPEAVACSPESVTGRHLQPVLAAATVEE
jgi:excinuclease ABC subunit A